MAAEKKTRRHQAAGTAAGSIIDERQHQASISVSYHE